MSTEPIKCPECEGQKTQVAKINGADLLVNGQPYLYDCLNEECGVTFKPQPRYDAEEVGYIYGFPVIYPEPAPGFTEFLTELRDKIAAASR